MHRPLGNRNYQQRVALERAIVMQPDVLLMDEPLSSLDERLRRRLQSVIWEMHRQLGFTLIYVTHQREEMEEMAVRIVRLRDGKLEPRE